MKYQSIIYVLLALTCVAEAHPPVIVTGWDSPSPAEYRKNLAEFEKWAVFDGTTIRPTRTGANGAEVDARNVFSREPWQWADFKTALEDLRAAKATTTRETYLMLNAMPGDVDWFDDAGWREVVNHWRLLARLAKQGQLRGLLYDAEPYVKPFKQFCYAAQAQASQHSFSEYRAKARQRGQEVMRAIGEEFPDAAIFAYRLFSDMLQLLDSGAGGAGAGDLGRALEPDTYGLQPSFVDGWMDVAPPTLTIIEGTEDIGYRANSPAEYNAAFTRERLRLPEFLAPENRDKFAHALRIGQSLYLDAYVNPPDSPWTIDHTGSSPARRLAANLSSALAASDGLVWLYGERARWWLGGDAKSQTWAQKFPGAVNAIRCAKDPAAFARTIIAKANTTTNLLPNADFAKTDGKVPTGWETWQSEDSHATFICVDGHAEIRGGKDAVLYHMAKVKPGSAYAVHLRVKSGGQSHGMLTIGWKSAEVKWTAQASNVRLLPAGPADPAGADGWQEITGLVEVPAGAAHLMFMATAGEQPGNTDSCRFKDPVLAIASTD